MTEKLAQNRRNDVDTLKGLSIIAVILYHIGVLRSGYLGVDVFFVVGGFLVIPKALEKIRENEFKYSSFIFARLFRLFPLILISCSICLAFGAFFMLPDDFENLSESVIASVFFSNNILSAITTKNYWDIVNAYKPLMHLWYIGVLAEFYVVFPIILIVENKIRIKLNKLNGGGYTLLLITSSISLALFLSPFISDGDKFYYLPCRFFELAVGGLIGILPNKKQKNRNGFIGNLFALGVVVLFLVGLIGFDFSEMGSDTIIIGETTTESSLILPNSILLLATVVMSSGVLLCGSCVLKNSRIISFIGKRSYSLFIFHQVILAFYRYSLSDDINVLFFVVYMVFVFALSEISYRFIEIIKPTKASVTVSLVAAFCLCFISGLVSLYERRGRKRCARIKYTYV